MSRKAVHCSRPAPGLQREQPPEILQKEPRVEGLRLRWLWIKIKLPSKPRETQRAKAFEQERLHTEWNNSKIFSSLRHPLQEANLHSLSNGLSFRFLDRFQKYLWCHWLSSAVDSLGLSDSDIQGAPSLISSWPRSIAESKKTWISVSVRIGPKSQLFYGLPVKLGQNISLLWASLQPDGLWWGLNEVLIIRHLAQSKWLRMILIIVCLHISFDKVIKGTSTKF